MQLILVDTSVVSVVAENFERNITIDKSCIRQCLLAYKQVSHNSNQEERAKKQLVSEIMKTEDDIGGSLLIAIRLLPVEYGDVEMFVTPSIPQRSIFRSLVEKFQEKVKISVFLKWHSMVPDQIDNSASLEGMKIDPVAFSCAGDLGLKYAIFTVTVPPPKMHVKIVANIDDYDIVAPARGASFPQKILEKGAFSDLIISAENGAEIKAHKSFLSVCSPVLEAMFASEMEESQTGRVDMSDLSEEGVRAFLRYVYYEDLHEPQENIRVAYELFYASHKYDVPGLEAEMTTLLVDAKDEDIGKELAFKMYMLTRNIETAVELKTKAMQILKCNTVDQLNANRTCGESSLESEIESFLVETNYEDYDLTVAFRMYMFTRNIDSAVELKRKAIRVLKAKWDELELIQEYKNIFEKPSNSKTAKDLCRDLAKIA